MKLAAFLRERLAAQAHADHGPPSDDFAHLGRDSSPLVDAAVLVAFIDAPRPRVLLTRRTATLSKHAGQVAFPGGRIDPGETAIEAALREAHEEIGLDPASPHVIGVAAPYLTGTNYRVLPVVAVIAPDLALTPNPEEVERIFDVAADQLFDSARHEERSGWWRGATRRYYSIRCDEDVVWGASAGIVVALGRRLGLENDPRLLEGLGV